MKKNYLLFIIPIFIFLKGNCQKNYLVTFDSYNLDYNYQWRGIDIPDSMDLKYEFVDYVKKNNMLEDERYYLNYQNEPLYNFLYSFDFNNDKRNDIIYSGTSGSEANEVLFFINKSGSFKLVFSVKQGIVKAKWKNNRLSELLTHNYGCCGDFRVINSVYEISYNNIEEPVFKKIFQTVEIDFMKKPLTYFNQPFDIKTRFNNVKLRISPIIDDTSSIIDFNKKTNGNIICILSKNAKGKAYGKANDNFGNEWFYIIIEPSNYTSNNIYMDDIDFPTWTVGWILEKEIKKE